MLRFSITFLLSLLPAMAFMTITIAHAQDANSNASTINRPIYSDTGSDLASPGKQSASSDNTLRLFAGVSHREVVPPAHEAIKPYLTEAQRAETQTQKTQKVTIHDFDIPPDLERRTPQAVPPPAKVSAPAQTHITNLSAQSARTAPVLPQQNIPALKAETTLNQAYMPAFGVARETTMRIAPPVTAPQSAQAAQSVPRYTIHWFMIPSWMAGVWLKDGDMTTSITDFRTGMTSNQNEWTENHLENKWGHQQDAKGNFWHADLLPEERDGMSAGKLVRFLVVERHLESSSAQQLVTRVHYLVSESNPWSHQPIDSFQQESLNHYSLTAKDHILNSSSNRVFTYQGQPIREGHLYSEFAKVGQFTPVATINGLDLKTSLDDYLQTHGMGQLRKQ